MLSPVASQLAEDEFRTFAERLCLIQCAARPRYMPLMLPMKTRRTAKLTVVLDLDETLVHTELQAQPNADHVVSLGACKAYVSYRPGLLAFLTAAANLFELVLFTAAERSYACQVLEKLDPEGTLVKYRLFREHCVPVNGMLIKDLRVLGRDLAHTVIVDNSHIAFAMNLENGIPIVSWFNDSADRELFGLFEFLQRLQQVPDVRPWLRSIYKLS